MIDPYPNLNMLRIIEGERGGAPAPRPAGTDRGGGLTPEGNIPDPATRAGQERADRLARRGLPPQLPPGGSEECFLPTPWGCLLSRDTATLIGVNLLLLVALIAGVLLLAGGSAGKVISVVAGGNPSHAAARNAMHKARNARHAAAAAMEGE